MLFVMKVRLESAWLWAGALLFVGLPGSGGSSAVAQQVPRTGKPLTFDVVSIHPSGTGGSMGFQITADGFQQSGISLWTTIMVAYLPMPLWSNDRLKNAPGWVANDGYDIIAKVAPEDLAKWQRQKPTMPSKDMVNAMLQAMLADRFKLVLHTMPAEVPGFALTLDKRGSRMKAAVPGESDSVHGMKLIDGGVAVGSARGVPLTWTFYEASMMSLKGFLSLTSRTTVEDRTGLTGRYDFVLRKADADPADAVAGTAVPDPGPKMMWNLAELGLKVDKLKVPTVTLVIDHIERPSEN